MNVNLRPHQLARSVAFAATWLVLLVVGLGLSRSLVVCTQPCCAGHVKIARTCDREAAVEGACGCCAHDHDAKGCGSEPPGRERVRRGCGRCVHVALGVDLGMPPSDVVLAMPAQAVFAERVHLPWASSDAIAVVHPPATGPPRCDARTARLSTTILRL